MDKKRPNTKGMVSRRFRLSQVELKIINCRTDEVRTTTIDLIDNKDPFMSARKKTPLQPGEMIYRYNLVSDRYVIAVMTPEEFLFRSRILDYIPSSSTQRKDENK